MPWLFSACGHCEFCLAPPDAAPLICAGITSCKGIKESQARPGEWIVISGTGGLGCLGAQYAKELGLHVCAVDIDDAVHHHPQVLRLQPARQG